MLESGKIARQFTACYTNSLKLAIENSCSTIAFPNISTGIYRFPKAEAAAIAVTAVLGLLEESEALKKVLFVCFDQENYELMEAELQKLGK